MIYFTYPTHSNSGESLEIAIVLLLGSSDGVDLHAEVVVNWLLGELLLESLLLLFLFGHESGSVGLELQLIEILSERLWRLNLSFLCVLDKLPAKVDGAFLSRDGRDEKRVQLDVSKLISVPLLLLIRDGLHVHRDFKITTLIELKDRHLWLIMEILGFMALISLYVVLIFWLLVHPVLEFLYLREVDVSENFAV